MEEHLHSDAYTANAACSWIQARKKDAGAFFLEVGFPGPHEPWDAPQEYVDLYEDRDLPGPVDFPGDLSGKPPQHEAIRAFLANAEHESLIDMPNATLEDVMKMRKHYFAKISYVDRQIQKALDALKEAGHLENSIVIFTSDHGEMLGDHGSAYKWLMYDSISQVPLVIKDFRFQGETRTTNDLVSLMDLGPTIMELSGGRTPTRLEGRALTPYLLNGEVNPRESVYCEDSYMIMKRTATEKLVHYIGAKYGEYYRLDEDPEEACNLWDEPEYVSRRKELQLEALDWLATSAFHNYGYKTQCEKDREYGVRWHANDPNIHGGNYEPKRTDVEL